MAKNNKGKVVQMLSPENYIRKKARTLPIFECLVKSDWKEAKMATVLVARNHINGNITVCTYLVDLMCLGVKDSMFLFNAPVHKYEEFKEKIHEGLGMTEVDYTLAHNIVYAGIEFAEEYGFKPHKDYESVTKFMLEEDTEDIELIEIECGVDGKPIYMRGPFEDDAKARRIVAQLEKTAGPGNYGYVDSPDDWRDEEDFDEDFSEEDEEDEEDEFKHLSQEEKKNIFIGYKTKEADLTEAEAIRLVKLIDSIFDDFTNPDLVDELYDKYYNDLDILLHEDEVPDEMLGVIPGSIHLSTETRNMFMEIIEMARDNPKKAEKMLDKFRKQTPDIPALYYLELFILQEKGDKKFQKKLDEYVKKFPDYQLLRIMKEENSFSSEITPEDFRDRDYSLDYFFEFRTSLHVQEMLSYVILKLFQLEIKGDASHLKAFGYAYSDLNFSESNFSLPDSILLMSKIQYITTHLNL